MNKCSLLKYSSFLIFLFCLLTNTPGFSSGTWVGGVTGFWDDGANWSDGMEPNALDFVIIPAGVTITIRVSGEVAETVLVQNGGALDITAGSLTIDGSTASGLIFSSGGMLTIASGTNLNISNTFSHGINIGSSLTTINNSGTITIGPNIGEEGIIVSSDGSLNLTNQVGGLITNSAPIDGHFLFIVNSGSSSMISNFGTIRVDMNDMGEDFFNINGSDVQVINQASGIITVNNVSDDAFNIDNGATLDNFGSITITDTEDQGFDISTPGSATNHTTGIINIIGVIEEEAIDVTGTFTNNGIINISGVELMSPGNAAIDIDGMGVFINNNLINVGLGANRDIIINVSSNATFNNLVCAIINITTEDPISNEGTFNNTGTITTIFTGTNINNGTFNNTGVISTPSGIFTVNPNALIGSMNITTSPIPATQITITGRAITICPGQSVNLRNLLIGSPQNALEYGISFGTYGLSNIQSPTTTTTFYVRHLNAITTCVDTARIIVKVEEKPFITARDTTVRLGQPVDLSTLLNQSATGTLDYRAINGRYGLTNPVRVTTTMPFIIRDSVQNAVGCVDTAQATIRVITTIPTMNQWGLLIFGLLILNISVFFLQTT